MERRGLCARGVYELAVQCPLLEDRNSFDFFRENVVYYKYEGCGVIFGGAGGGGGVF